MSSCGFGGMRRSAPIRRFVSSRSLVVFFMSKKKFRVSGTKEQLDEANSEFLYCYGQAMSAWASLEQALYRWFERSSRMKKDLAANIFYGARGFAARAEMMEAVIEHGSLLSATEITFLRAAVKKARQYVGFRNLLAHGEPRMNFIVKGAREKVLVKARRYDT